jgi:hypothetical protein
VGAGGCAMKAQVVETRHMVVEPQALADKSLVEYIRRNQRHEIVERLEELVGIPFAAAITQIASWEEETRTLMPEEEHGSAAFVYDPLSPRPVVVITRCRTRGHR